ncbi:MAG TPA: response regulator [Anaerolineae bacterium]|nr:response regulator [Anaerolineae bacterium]
MISEKKNGEKIAKRKAYAKIRNMTIPRILLVDDQREVSRMLRSSLELSGKDYVVVDVPSGEEALLELGRGPVDLLVTDLRLPGISGLELLEKVNQLNPYARAIMITGHPTEEAREQAEKFGVVAFLQKPIGTNIFLEAVEYALKLRGLPGSPVHVHEEAREKISDRLKTVRIELGAEAALLIDDHREVIVQAGELSELNLDESLPSLMTAFSAGLKVSNLVGALLPGNLQYFDGDTHALYMTNVGAYYALLIVFRGKQESGQMGAVVHYGRRAAEDLMDVLSSLGELENIDEAMRVEPPEVEWVEQMSEPDSQQKNEEQESDLMPSGDEAEVDAEFELEKLDVADQEVEREDAEKYWEQAISTSPKLDSDEGETLSYEQARDKGLLDDQSEEKPSEIEGA